MHRKYSHLSCLLICAALVTSCDAFFGADGRVVNASGEPIAGALVHLKWGRERGKVDTSDTLGRFVLGGGHGFSWPNSGTLIVCKAGYIPWRTDFSEAEKQFSELEVRLKSEQGRAHPCP